MHSKEELKLIISLHHQRKLSKNLTFQFSNTEYQRQGYGKGYCLHGATMTVCEDFNGSITLLYKGKTLAYPTFQQGESIVMIADDKTVLNHVEKILHPQQKSTWKPAPDHHLAATINPFFNTIPPYNEYKKGTFKLWVDTFFFSGITSCVQNLTTVLEALP